MSKDVYSFAVLAAHGTPASNGELTTELVKRIEIKPAFLWLEGCSTGNIDTLDNILLETVYNPNSGVLLAKGGTTNVGGLGNNTKGFYGHNIAEKLLEEKSLGEALLYHLQDSLIYPWSEEFELHNAPNIFVGDLSLTLFPKRTSGVINKQVTTNNFYLSQNYPNPFNPTTTIDYSIPSAPLSLINHGSRADQGRETRDEFEGVEDGFVSLKVYDMLGREITTLVNKEQTPGTYKVSFDARNLPSGLYMYVLRISSSSGKGNDFIKSCKMILIK